MKFILALLLATLWSFYVALLLDRPDLAKAVMPPWDKIAHGAFGVVLLRAVVGLSWDEIKHAKSWRAHGLGIVLRNSLVTLLGIGFLVFTCRAVLDGIDHTHLRKLW